MENNEFSRRFNNQIFVNLNTKISAALPLHRNSSRVFHSTNIDDHQIVTDQIPLFHLVHICVNFNFY